jgi:hypothetical protein
VPGARRGERLTNRLIVLGKCNGVYYADGTTYYFRDGLLHRPNGATAVQSIDREEYWIDGVNAVGADPSNGD